MRIKRLLNFLYIFFIMFGLIDFCIQRNIFENEIFTFSVMFIYTLNLICTFGLYVIYIDFRKEYINEKKQRKK